jgi:hypothetical protein
MVALGGDGVLIEKPLLRKARRDTGAEADTTLDIETSAPAAGWAARATEGLQIFGEELTHALSDAMKPTGTLILVARRALDGMLFEVEAMDRMLPSDVL